MAPTFSFNLYMFLGLMGKYCEQARPWDQGPCGLLTCCGPILHRPVPELLTHTTESQDST